MNRADLHDWPEKSRELARLLARAGLGDQAPEGGADTRRAA
jgi:hypothetical protein